MKYLILLLALTVAAMLYIPTVETATLAGYQANVEVIQASGQTLAEVTRLGSILAASAIIFSIFGSRRPTKPKGVFNLKTTIGTALKRMAAKLEVGWRNSVTR